MNDQQDHLKIINSHTVLVKSCGQLLKVKFCKKKSNKTGYGTLNIVRHVNFNFCLFLYLIVLHFLHLLWYGSHSAYSLIHFV